MMLTQSLVIGALLSACLVECQQDKDDPKVAYDSDSRKDWYQLSESSPWRDITAHSIAALVRTSNLGTPDSQGVYHTLERDVYPESRRLGAALGLCDNQRYLLDPTWAFCSGTLVAPDRIVTAGHCLDSSSCATVSFVFKYYVTGRDSAGYPEFPEITIEDVYHCAAVVSVQTQTLDYAVVYLDRPATNYIPAPVYNDSTPLSIGDHVTIIGFPSGIPAKIDSGGSVVSPRASQHDYFLATTDSFAGNSGSGVFDATRRQIGILVQGATDYVASTSGTCNIVNVIRNCERNCGERITYASNAIEAVPDCIDDGECEDGGQCYRPCPTNSTECTGFCIPPTLDLANYTVGDLTCGITESGSNVNAVNILGNPSGDRVYQLTIESFQIVTINACDSNFDTMLWIFNGTAESGYNQVAYNDDSPNCNGFQSRIDTPLQPGIYYVVIEGFGNNEGDYSFTVSCNQAKVEPDPGRSDSAAELPTSDSSADSQAPKDKDRSPGWARRLAVGVPIAVLALAALTALVHLMRHPRDQRGLATKESRPMV